MKVDIEDFSKVKKEFIDLSLSLEWILGSFADHVSGLLCHCCFLFQWNKDFLNLEGKVLVHDQEIQSYDSQG